VKRRHTYVEFRDMVADGLRDEVDGLTWGDLREKQGWDQERPCYTWVGQVENDIGLKRGRRGNRVYWKIPD
jgi:hypothetical protein